jgi:predicted Zn-dependent protease with MMP-like domain
MVFVTRRELEEYIREAIAALPPNIREALENVAFVVEEEPEDRDLLGLYQGIPHTKRGSGYSMVLPDTITIYRRMIEDEA